MSYVIFLVLVFLLLLGGGAFALLRYQRARQQKLTTDPVLYIQTFGKRLIVPLAECKIAHRVFETTNENGQSQSVDACLVTFTKNIDGVDHLFKSQPIYLDPGELKRQLTHQKKAQISYNPQNPAQHYFDLSFLKANR